MITPLHEKPLALRIEHLTKTIDKKTILSDVSLTVRTGEVFGFLGPNGAGKTTTMKCILGLVAPSGGTVEVLGGTLDIEGKKRIGFLPENAYFYSYLTGREFLRFCGRFFPMTREALEASIDELLVTVNLERAADRRLGTYSKGMLQRVGLAQALVHTPELVFLDEPMSGLDPIGRRMVKDIILSLKARGTTVFFNTHILSDVESLCDRCAIIHSGHIVADMPISDLHEPLEDFFIRTVRDNTEGVLEVV